MYPICLARERRSAFQPPRLTWARESLSECAGSVETTSVVCPSAARRSASEDARLVFPTPPLPLIMMYLREGPSASLSKTLSLGGALGSSTAASLGKSSLLLDSCNVIEGEPI